MSTSAEDNRPQLEVMAELINQRFEMIDQILEKHDEMLGRMLGGMTQLWSGLESLIEFIVDEKTPEEKEKFLAGLNWYSTELWKAIKQRVDVAGSDTETAGAMGDVPGGVSPGGPDPGGDVPADRGSGGGASDAEPDGVTSHPTSREDGLDGGDGSGGG